MKKNAINFEFYFIKRSYELKKSTAVLTILLGATFMSFNGALIRLLESANGFQVLFYRSIGLSLLVLIFISLKRKISFIKVFDNIDKWDIFQPIVPVK